MRREQKKNNKLIIIIILAGISTLLSFFFDQRVIQTEDKIRELEVGISDNRVNIANLQSTINSTNELSYNITKSINYYKDRIDLFYLYNGILNVQVYGTEDEKTEFFKNIDKEKLIKLKADYKKNAENILRSYDYKIDEIKIFNNQILENKFVKEIISNNDGYEMIKGDFDIFKAKDKFKKFPFDKYLPDKDLIEMSEEEFQNQDDYIIYSKIRDPMNEIDDIEDEYWDLLQRLKVKYDNYYIFFSEELEYYGTQKNKNNLYILFSIFFQILSLTILLFLFREMIIQKKWDI